MVTLKFCGHFLLYCDDYKAYERLSYDVYLQRQVPTKMFVTNMMFDFIPAHHRLIAPSCSQTRSKNDSWGKLNSVVDCGCICWKWVFLTLN